MYYYDLIYDRENVFTFYNEKYYSELDFESVIRSLKTDFYDKFYGQGYDEKCFNYVVEELENLGFKRKVEVYF